MMENERYAIRESDRNIFVNGTEHFFQKLTAIPAEVGTPSCEETIVRVLDEFSAVIAISGKRRGYVSYTAPRAMIGEVMGYFGETDRSDDLLADCIGEIANTICGNAREHLGPGYTIGVPAVIRGRTEEAPFYADAPAVVIPIKWNGYRSSLILCLDLGENEKFAPDFTSLED